LPIEAVLPPMPFQFSITSRLPPFSVFFVLFHAYFVSCRLLS
jgi:hypothetical protein